MGAVLVVWMVTLGPRVALAHAFGPSSVSRTVAFELAPGALHIAVVLDLAELPAMGELERLDGNGDGTVPTSEQDRYVSARVSEIAAAWTVEVDDRRVPPRFVRGHVEVGAGESGLSTLRVLAELVAPVDTSHASLRVHFHDDLFADRPGVRDVRAGDTAFARAEVPTVAPHDGVRRVDDLRFVFVRTSTPSVPTPARMRVVYALAAVVAAMLVALVVWRTSNTR